METDQKAILEHCLKGDIDAVRALLQKNPELIAARNSEGATPLSMAAGGHLEIVKFLLQQGADLNTVGQDGTALHIAVWEAQEEITLFLLERGLDPSATSASGETALMAAGYKGLTQIGMILIEYGAEVNCRTSKGTTDMFDTSPPVCGESPLHLAAAYGHRDFVELLLKNGADKNIEDHTGQRPVHWAVRYKQDELVPLLK